MFELPSKDGNITPEKVRKSRQMQFRDKTAYVWGLCYRWDPSLSMNPVRQFAHFMPPCIWTRLKYQKQHVLCISSALTVSDFLLWIIWKPQVSKAAAAALISTPHLRSLTPAGCPFVPPQKVFEDRSKIFMPLPANICAPTIMYLCFFQKVFVVKLRLVIVPP